MVTLGVTPGALATWRGRKSRQIERCGARTRALPSRSEGGDTGEAPSAADVWEEGDEEEGLDAEAIAKRVEEAGASTGREHGAPDWVETVKEAAKVDPGWAEILSGDEDDPEEIVRKVREKAQKKAAEEYMEETTEGTLPDVSFREVDPFNLWIWIEFQKTPEEGDKELLDEVFNSWYILGRLGAFDESNMQVRDAGDPSYLHYKAPKDSSGYRSEPAKAFMHEKGEMEVKGRWARIWLNLGTSDETGLDCLINSLLTVSEEWTPLKAVIVGGVNSDWMEGTDDPPGRPLAQNDAS